MGLTWAVPSLPGVGIALDALVRRTSKLPPVNCKPPAAIGHNTIHAMQSGIINGYVAMTEGMVKRFKAELAKDAKVIAHGRAGQCHRQPDQDYRITAPWLTLDGLRIIWELNRII